VNNLVYCVYGATEARQIRWRGHDWRLHGAENYIHEALFSVLSAIRHERPPISDWRLIIYTDNPRPFSRFNAIIEPLDERRLSEWGGPANFVHRRKIFVLQHALRNYGRSVLVDTDTYFLKSPRKLFEKISAGNAIMHMREARLRRVPHLASLCEALCAAPFEFEGRSYKFTPDWLIWNSGVVGIDPVDEPLLNDTVRLTDAIHERSPSNQSEQISFAVLLQESTRLRETDEIVYHYWPAHLREPFHELLAKLFSQFPNGDLNELSERLYVLRPRATLNKRAKARLKTLLFKAGWTSVGMRSSAF
jgi:hypothetical protein